MHFPRKNKNKFAIANVYRCENVRFGILDDNNNERETAKFDSAVYNGRAQPAVPPKKNSSNLYEKVNNLKNMYYNNYSDNICNDEQIAITIITKSLQSLTLCTSTYLCEPSCSAKWNMRIMYIGIALLISPRWPAESSNCINPVCRKQWTNHTNSTIIFNYCTIFQ